MRRLHWRVRTLMLAVAAAAVLVWGGMMVARSCDYSRRARFYAAQEAGWRATAGKGSLPAEFRSECVEYFARLARKYDRATWRPWRPVAPDPHAPGYERWLEQERRAKEGAWAARQSDGRR